MSLLQLLVVDWTSLLIGIVIGIFIATALFFVVVDLLQRQKENRKFEEALAEHELQEAPAEEKVRVDLHD